MDYLRSIYPSLNQRSPFPSFYLPTAYAFYALTPLLPGKTSRIFITFPLLLILAARRPLYTVGDVNGDYGTSVATLSLCLMCLDFFVLCQLEGDEVRFQGASEDDCRTTLQKTKWSLRLMTATRGVGWNWQVKGIPHRPGANEERFRFARRQLLGASRSWVYKIFSLYLLGFALVAERQASSKLVQATSTAAIGWCGAAWGWNGIKGIYRFGAALTVAIGVSEPWEWPPIFGSLSEAWSVRQMWSAVWHQIVRRVVQKPGVRLARLLGLRKGSLASKYTQLYIAFTVSMLMHEWQIFNAVRRDVGEFKFFMAQPFAITAEDFVQWCWRRYVPAGKQRAKIAKVIGFVWTFAWFSYSLPPFVRGLFSVDIIGADVAGPWAISLGKEQALALLR